MTRTDLNHPPVRGTARSAWNPEGTALIESLSIGQTEHRFVYRVSEDKQSLLCSWFPGGEEVVELSGHLRDPLKDPGHWAMLDGANGRGRHGGYRMLVQLNGTGFDLEMLWGGIHSGGTLQHRRPE